MLSALSSRRTKDINTSVTDTSASSLYLYPEGSNPLNMAAVQKLTQPTQPTQPLESASSSSLLLVKIVSSRMDSTFTLPVSLVTQRELEMQAASRKFGIPKERWNGSLLYKAFKEQGRMEVVLMPEKECAEQNYSHCLRWEPWLTDLVQSYYQTGQLAVPETCQGLDLLLLLEYFGIIYQPNQLTFDSTAAYERVKIWSDYLTARSQIADWIAVAISSVQQTHYFFATTPTMDQWMQLGQERLANLEGGLSLPASKTSCGVVFELFNRTEPEGTAGLMRLDFSVYLQNILTNVDVSFPVKPVTVHFDELSIEQKKRAILMINVINADEPAAAEKVMRTKSELSFPVDELVEEDMATGRLENLMQQIDARSHASYTGQNSAYTAQFLTMFESTIAPVRKQQQQQHEKQARPKQQTPPLVPRTQQQPQQQPPVAPRTQQQQQQQPPVVPRTQQQQQQPPQPPVETRRPQQQPPQPVETQPKSPVKLQKRLESPRIVTAIDHIYQDLDHEQLAELAIETSYHTVPESTGKKVDSIMPVEIYGDSNINDPNTAVEPETTLLMTEPVYNEVPAVRYEAPAYVAPVTSVVHAERNEAYSVTSALTNPNFDDEGSLLDLLEGGARDVRAQALREEWIQESVMNRDVFQRAQQLLREESQRFDQQKQRKETVNRERETEALNETYDIWDYLMSACQVLDPAAHKDLCFFTAPASTANGLSPTRSVRPALPNDLSPTRSVRPALPRPTSEGSNLLADALCSPMVNPIKDATCSPIVNGGNDVQLDEQKIVEPIPEERPNLSAATYHGLVKERMVQTQKQAVDEQTRQDSLASKQARTTGTTGRQEFEGQGIEVCHGKRPSPPGTPSSVKKSPPSTPSSMKKSPPGTPSSVPKSLASSPTRSKSQPSSSSPQKPSPPGTPPRIAAASKNSDSPQSAAAPQNSVTPKMTAAIPKKTTATAKKTTATVKKTATAQKAASPATMKFSSPSKATRKSHYSNTEASTASPANSSTQASSTGSSPFRSPTKSTGSSNSNNNSNSKNSNKKTTKAPDADKRRLKGLFRRRKGLESS